MSGLKVIAGSERGRPLRAPRGLTTRPTSGRARQALFNMLGDLAGLSVLDLYAGSGALGIEALSRGARSAVFVESERAALGCIRHNLSELGLEERARVLPVRVEVARKSLQEERFDLILCDPPWAEIAAAWVQIERWVFLCLEPDGRLVLEHPAASPPGELQGSTLLAQRSWGDTGMSIFSRARL
ncbi:MAG TPA: 16S rRNA (guanine(966)-N(2))-methyltransferase RsmD [Polyangiaceae bacterium]|nr:16S rRNA (guanine(966)-N(2))-methyltransferase RsmD [Polyangiaceae bacterium]